MLLLGIINNNTIVLIHRFDIDRETTEFSGAIIHASQQQFRLILMSSLTTVYGLLPMAILGGALSEPMATVMIGRLVLPSTVTLFQVPSLCNVMPKHWGAPASATPT